ncbi:MAG: zinc dependent phospholipase C family protein [bacterium]|nr:zinc dependent phospholipase C family protein [bacterium]
MAPLNMHVVVGERVFPQIPALAAHSELYGPFLLGCIVVDINGFCPSPHSLPYSHTHFVERVDAIGPLARAKSCENFLTQLPSLVARPFPLLSDVESAFLAGYLCHLAVDEEWKHHDWHLIHERGINVWKELPVPGGVLLTAFAAVSQDVYQDFSAVRAALQHVTIPDVLTHIPHGELEAMWDLVKEFSMSTNIAESFYQVSQAQGMSADDAATLRKEHEQYWDEAMVVIEEYLGHPQTRLPRMTRRAVEVLPQLFQQLCPVDDGQQ